MTYDNSDQTFTRPYSTPTARVFNYRMPAGKQGRLVVAAAAVAATALVIAAVTMAMFITYKGSVQGQMSQLRQEVATAQSAEESALTRAESNGASQFSSMSAKIVSINQALGYLGQFNQTCAQALETQAGPGTYYFMCSAERPAG